MDAVAPLYLLAVLLVVSTAVFARVLARHPSLARVAAMDDEAGMDGQPVAFRSPGSVEEAD